MFMEAGTVQRISELSKSGFNGPDLNKSVHDWDAALHGAAH